MSSISVITKPLSYILGFSGLTPFLFYSHSIEASKDVNNSIPKGDLLLKQWKQHLPESFSPLVTSFETGSQKGSRLTFIAYSAAILSFLGGVHFNAAYTSGKHFMLIASMAPSLLAWPAVVLSSSGKTDTACSILSLGYIGALGLDRIAVASNSLSPSYFRLRVPLTAIVLGTHIWTSLALRKEDSEAAVHVSSVKDVKGGEKKKA